MDNQELREGLLAALEEITKHEYVDSYSAFKVLRDHIGFAIDEELDEALARAQATLEFREAERGFEFLRLLNGDHQQTESGPKCPHPSTPEIDNG